MEDRKRFHQTSAGGFLREADRWTLITDTSSGAMTIEHEWSYIDPFGEGKPGGGTAIVSVENFLMGDADESVKQKLRDALLDSSTSKR